MACYLSRVSWATKSKKVPTFGGKVSAARIDREKLTACRQPRELQALPG
jgi:hypothetical protein